MSNLFSELSKEIQRNKELLKVYEDIGPAGAFGAMFIRQEINNGEQAMETGEATAMVVALAKLRESE
ncbi:MAG: hypothetical protein ACTSW7_00825 [Candidatus Thorarchaeota archaeon]|nr:hypothetical protein [Thermoplasmatales archaeon]